MYFASPGLGHVRRAVRSQCASRLHVCLGFVPPMQCAFSVGSQPTVWLHAIWVCRTPWCAGDAEAIKVAAELKASGKPIGVTDKPAGGSGGQPGTGTGSGAPAANGQQLLVPASPALVLIFWRALQRGGALTSFFPLNLLCRGMGGVGFWGKQLP